MRASLNASNKQPAQRADRFGTLVYGSFSFVGAQGLGTTTSTPDRSLYKNQFPSTNRPSVYGASGLVLRLSADTPPSYQLAQLVIGPSPTRGLGLVPFETAIHRIISAGRGASATINVIVSAQESGSGVQYHSNRESSQRLTWPASQMGTTKRQTWKP